MEPLVFGLVAVAAILHAAWNVLAKTSGDPFRSTAIGMVVAAAIVGPAAVAYWVALGRPAIPADAVWLAAISGLIETAYVVCLSAAYARGDLSLVYPIARGSAPLLAVLAGVALLDERLEPLGWLGVACLLAGILVVQRPWNAIVRGVGGGGSGRRTGSLEPAVALPLLTGVAIAAYSAVDRVGVRLISPWLYAGLMWPVMAFGLVAWAIAARRATRLPPRGDWSRGVVVGIFSLAAYTLVLVAYSIAPLAVVAPLRESAIVLVSGWGALKLGEAAGSGDAGARLLSAVLIVLGAVLLGIAG